jgi:CIC family chloride channel protein
MKRFLLRYLFIFKSLETGDHTIMIFLAIGVGLAGGIGAVGFRHLINLIQTIAYGSSADLLEVVQHIPWYGKFWLPAAGGLIVGPLVYFFASEAKGHGVPEVMEAVTLKGGVIRKRLVLVKSFASAISIASGGSVGREGPIVQIGSAIGSTIGQILSVSAERMRTLVGCGAAAGIAATFNAPIAGSMFALEIILGEFGLATFSPIVISSVVATAISRHFLGDFPAFVVPAYELVSAWEFPLYVTMGVMCAAAGVLFTRTLYKTEDLFDKLRFPEYLKAALGGMILGTIALAYPQVLSVGYGAIDMALAQQLALWLMLVLVFVKILATAITIGSGGSGGIFAPSLLIGAMAGGFFGTLVNHIFPDITASPGAYAIVGMGAVVSATTHGPITAILMLFEMTGDYKIILPLMITCIISSLAGGLLLKESIYTLKLIRRGINIKAGKEVNILKSILVRDVMSTKIESVKESDNLHILADKISKSKYNSFPVLNAHGKLTGILSFFDYRDALFDEFLKDLVVAKDIATTKVVTINADSHLFEALERITPKDFSIMPVVASDDPQHLVGVLSRRDIMRAYNKAVLSQSLASGFEN